MSHNEERDVIAIPIFVRLKVSELDELDQWRSAQNGLSISREEAAKLLINTELSILGKQFRDCETLFEGMSYSPNIPMPSRNNRSCVIVSDSSTILVFREM